MNKEEKLAKQQKKKRTNQFIAIFALVLTIAGLVLPIIISVTGAM